MQFQQTYVKKFLQLFLKVFLGSVLVVLLVTMGSVSIKAKPYLDKTVYHSWEEVEAYLFEVARDPELRKIVQLIPIGYTREGRLLNVLQISRKGIFGKPPHRKPAAFIMGAHHAREHVSKETVLALIDKIIHSYGKYDKEGAAITYLVDNGTYYLLPWVNPDGGTNEYNHNPEQRKTNRPGDEPQIGAAECDDCGDGFIDGDSPDIETGDVGEVNRNEDFPSEIIFSNNGIISRKLQLWYENDLYNMPVLDERVARVQPGFSVYTFNYEGKDPDNDGLYNAYSGEDFVGGVDPNRNYGEPLWGYCENDEGCSWLSGAQTYAGPEPFSEPETAAVARFLRHHPNIVTLESLHSGINEIYPPWFIYPDDEQKQSMDMLYQDAVAEYISAETNYEVVYGGQYAVKGDTTGYSYIGSSKDPTLGLEFFPGGVLSFTTEVYGMGSVSGSAEAIKDWFPHHYKEFDTNYPQGIFLTWDDFPLCTTCDPGADDILDGTLPFYFYTQYVEYFVFNSEEECGGEDDADIFHCGYWGKADSKDYYADFDIFAYFNPPAANKCYKDWNCQGEELVRTVDKNLKHLLYRLYIAPFVEFKDDQISYKKGKLKIPLKNQGFLRTSVMTSARTDADSFKDRYYDYGHVQVELLRTYGFKSTSENTVNLGWLGGKHPKDTIASEKEAVFDVEDFSAWDSFLIKAGSEKTGYVLSLIIALPDKFPLDLIFGKSKKLKFKTVWTNQIEHSKFAENYFEGEAKSNLMYARGVERGPATIQQEMKRAQEKRKAWREVDGPIEILPGKTIGVKVKKYHQ